MTVACFECGFRRPCVHVALDDGEVVELCSECRQLPRSGARRRRALRVAGLEVVNRWMREHPAELEQDDPRFFAEIREARDRVLEEFPLDRRPGD